MKIYSLVSRLYFNQAQIIQYFAYSQMWDTSISEVKLHILNFVPPQLSQPIILAFFFFSVSIFIPSDLILFACLAYFLHAFALFFSLYLPGSSAFIFPSSVPSITLCNQIITGTFWLLHWKYSVRILDRTRNVLTEFQAFYLLGYNAV
jgi:hypothetical protein